MSEPMPRWMVDMAAGALVARRTDLQAFELHDCSIKVDGTCTCVPIRMLIPGQAVDDIWDWMTSLQMRWDPAFERIRRRLRGD